MGAINARLQTLVEVPQFRVALREVGTVKYPRAFIDDVRAAAEVFHRMTEDADREYLLALYLSSRNQPAGCEVIAVGSRLGVSSTPAEVFKGALLANAASMVLGHNHTSGDPTPSAADRVFTRNAVRIGHDIGVAVLDHVIVGRAGEFYSMREHGEIFETGAA